MIATNKYYSSILIKQLLEVTLFEIFNQLMPNPVIYIYIFSIIIIENNCNAKWINCNSYE